MIGEIGREIEGGIGGEERRGIMTDVIEDIEV